MTEQTPTGPRADLTALTAAIRSIERGENPAAPAPRGNAAEARRRRKEAMAAEAAGAADTAAETGTGGPGASPDQRPATPEAGPEAVDGGASGAGSASEAQAATGTGAPESGPSAAAAPGREAADAGAFSVGTANEAQAAAGTGPEAGGAGASGAGPAGAAAAAARGREPGGTGGAAAADRREEGAGGRSAEAADGQRGQSAPEAAGASESEAQRANARVRGPGGAGGAVGAARGQGGEVAGARSGRSRAPEDAGAAALGREYGGIAGTDAAAVEAAGVVLREGGAPRELARDAVRVLGDGAAGRLRQDPWGVLTLPGVRVEQADAFARALLGAQCGPGDERRARALIGHVMEKAAAAGHTALAADALRTALARHAVPDPAAAVTAAVEDGLVLVFREGEGEDDEAAEPAEDDSADVSLLLGLDRYALAEESLADGCVRLLRSFEGDDLDWASLAAATPSPSAADLVRAAAGSGLVLHTGGEAARAEPAALVAAARAAGLRAYAAAYTPNGRDRLATALGDSAADAAVTVEGLLAGREGPGRGADHALALDLLAVLDAPQLSVVEGADLVEALPDGARLVLSGDLDTLWSTGPGRAFADLLAAGICPRVASRTPDPGPIGELLSCVSAGELAAVDAPGKEVVVVPVRDPREAVHRTVQLVADSVPRAFGVPADRTTVITPALTGPVGARALNAALKERLNPGPGRFAGFDPGDRVVHVPAFGRALHGTVAGAEPGGLRLECEQGPVLVPREAVASAVRHGWAVTAHQAAGTRWPAAVAVVPGDAGALLTRSWVYTAFSRGERHLSVVQGADQALAAAVAGPHSRPRTTRLPAILRTLAADA